MLYAFLATAGWVPARWGVGVLLVPRDLEAPVPVVRRTTASGLQVNVPLPGDLCFGAPLPCAPRLDRDLVWDGMFRRAAPPGRAP